MVIDLSALYRSKRLVLVGALSLHVCLALAFTIVAFSASGQCFLLPCDKEDAFSLLTSVNPGRSFQVTVTGLCFILHGVSGLWFVRRRVSSFYGGAYVGATVVMVWLALGMASSWGSLVSLLQLLSSSVLAPAPPLIGQGGGADGGGEEAVVMAYSVNTAAMSGFRAMSVLSSVEVALLVKLLVLMSVCRDDLLAEDDGASPDDLTPIAGRAKVFSYYHKQQQQQGQQGVSRHHSYQSVATDAEPDAEFDI